MREADLSDQYEAACESACSEAESAAAEALDLPLPSYFRSRSHSYLRAIQAGCSQEEDSVSLQSLSPPPSTGSLSNSRTLPSEYPVRGRALWMLLWENFRDQAWGWGGLRGGLAETKWRVGAQRKVSGDLVGCLAESSHLFLGGAHACRHVDLPVGRVGICQGGRACSGRLGATFPGLHHLPCPCSESPKASPTTIRGPMGDTPGPSMPKE